MRLNSHSIRFRIRKYESLRAGEDGEMRSYGQSPTLQELNEAFIRGAPKRKVLRNLGVGMKLEMSYLVGHVATFSGLCQGAMWAELMT